MNEIRGLHDGRTDALILSDSHELGTRAMQAMKAALSGADARAYSTQLPVSIVDVQSANANPIVARLSKEPH
jgi:hypothetical protein